MTDVQWIALGIGVLFAGLISAVAWDAATCTEWGPERPYTYFIQSGNTMIPVNTTTRDCVRHSGDGKP